MITPGSKLLYGLGAGSLVAAVLWFIAEDGGSIGSVALLFLAIASIFFGAIVSYTRDGHVLSTDVAAHAGSAANQRSLGGSLWPLGTAISLGFLVVGLVSNAGIFKVGVGLVIAMLGEWMVQAHSERSSGDAGYNERVRGYIVHPLELPVAGALLLAIIVLAFSRIMLALPMETGPLVFALAGAVVLAFGSLIAFKPNVNRKVVGGICGIALVALAGTGVATALDGEREELTVAAEEDHFAHRECTEEKGYADKKAARSVSAKSSIAVTVTLSGGELSAEVDGYNGPQNVVTLQRSNPSTILFVNEDEGYHRLLLKYGTITEDLGGGVTRDVELEACTLLVDKDGQQAFTVTISQPSFASTEPYSFSVPGVADEIEVVVP
ncbi:MAG: hypothetical protein ACKOD2_17460 [Ilumatobacteraceae bacterium]